MIIFLGLKTSFRLQTEHSTEECLFVRKLNEPLNEILWIKKAEFTVLTQMGK